jgi:hypothetical protein
MMFSLPFITVRTRERTFCNVVDVEGERLLAREVQPNPAIADAEIANSEMIQSAE